MRRFFFGPLIVGVLGMFSIGGASAAKDLQYSGESTVILGVKNLQNALTWYQEVLELDLIFKVEDQNWAEVTSPVPNSTIALSQVSEVLPASTLLTLGVKDLDKTRKILERRGVIFDGPTQVVEGQVKLATFLDPDGNVLTLFQNLRSH